MGRRPELSGLLGRGGITSEKCQSQGTFPGELSPQFFALLSWEIKSLGGVVAIDTVDT